MPIQNLLEPMLIQTQTDPILTHHDQPYAPSAEDLENSNSASINVLAQSNTLLASDLLSAPPTSQKPKQIIPSPSKELTLWSPNHKTISLNPNESL